MAWNGNTEKFNDTKLTSGKAENFGGWGEGWEWGGDWKTRNMFLTKYMIVITFYQIVEVSFH